MDNHILETSQYKVFKKLCKNKIMAYIITGASEDPQEFYRVPLFLMKSMAVKETYLNRYFSSIYSVFTTPLNKNG